MMSLHTLQTFVVVVFVMAIALNLWAQHRRGIRAFVLSPHPAKRFWEVLSIGGLSVWFALIGLEGIDAIGESVGPTWVDSALADGIGAALMLGGLLIGLLAYMHMGRSWRIGIDESANERLVTHGIFAWSRNPIYLFIDMLAVGVLLASGTAFFIVTSPIVLLGIHLRILEEELYLHRTHKSEFESYRGVTRRYLGWMGKRGIGR